MNEDVRVAGRENASQFAAAEMRFRDQVGPTANANIELVKRLNRFAFVPREFNGSATRGLHLVRCNMIPALSANGASAS